MENYYHLFLYLKTSLIYKQTSNSHPSQTNCNYEKFNIKYLDIIQKKNSLVFLSFIVVIIS